MTTFARWRHVPLIALLAVAALLAAGGAVAIYNDRIFQIERTGNARVEAEIFAATVTAALVFDDKAATREYVGALAVHPEIDAAAVYDAQDRLVATYVREGAEPPPETVPDAMALSAEGGRIVMAPVTQSNMLLGKVYLRRALEPWSRRLGRNVSVALLALMASILLGVLIAAQSTLAKANNELIRQADDLAEANRSLNHQIEVRETTEQALRQSQKMEAIGQLTGGVAHDFNNLLQAIYGCLRLIDRRANSPEVTPLVEAGMRAVERGSKLTQQLLAFARRQALHPEPIDIAQRLDNMSELLMRAMRADIALTIDLEPGLWPVEVDVTQFELALLNLAANARDAMPGPGRLVISARNVYRPPGDPEGFAGDFVHLTIADSGVGMSSEIAARAFEPFFTTKETGKGSGLGLSQVYGFARQSGGTARIDSVMGSGTAVTIILARCEKAPSAPQTRSPEPTASGGGDHVLLVEDDPMVAELMAANIEDMGFRVTSALSARDALKLLAQGDPIDILFTDVVMPGEMNGVELARAARRLRPGLPVLLTTGYNEVAAAEQDFPILKKPYGSDQLAEMLKKMSGAKA